jgi:hypothetical protein
MGSEVWRQDSQERQEEVIMISRSPFMWAVCKKFDLGYLKRSGKGWTRDPMKARWYAYFRYAQDKRDRLVKLGEDKNNLYFNQRGRDENYCPAGGQKFGRR